MYSYYYEVGRYVSKCAKFELIHFETKKCLSKEKIFKQLIVNGGLKKPFDSLKCVLLTQSYIGLGEIETF
jgi:hypothetical protein